MEMVNMRLNKDINKLKIPLKLNALIGDKN